jgi:hypothetical protein
MAAIWAKKIKIKAKAAYTTFSLFSTLTVTIPNFQPHVVNKLQSVTTNEHISYNTTNCNQPVSKTDNNTNTFQHT